MGVWLPLLTVIWSTCSCQDSAAFVLDFLTLNSLQAVLGVTHLFPEIGGGFLEAILTSYSAISAVFQARVCEG